MTKLLALVAIIGAVCYVLILIRARVSRLAQSFGLESPTRRPDLAADRTTEGATDGSTGAGGAQGAATDLAHRARDLRVSGRKTDAVRLVRTETGMEWDDAERFVKNLR